MPFWHRLVIVGAVLVVTGVVARLIDRGIARRDLAPGAATRYRVLRRSISTAVVMIGLLSALLVIPQVRAVAGALLASSAVLGIVIGFASQRTIGNFVAGLLIAFTQPIRLGDRVELEDTAGIVEEIGLTDRKSTRLNSSHVSISYAVFCLKKKKKKLITCITIKSSK